MASPYESDESERSPKRRRVNPQSSTSQVYDNHELPFSGHRSGPNDARDPPLTSVTRGSNSDASTPRPPPQSPLDGTARGATPKDDRNGHATPDDPRLRPETLNSHHSSHYSEEEGPNSRSSPAPIGTPQEFPPEVRYKQKFILRGHKRGVACVKFSPDGNWIASCSADATVKTWSAQTGAHQHTFHGHLAGISTLAWAPDSRTIASGSDDKTIRLWSAATGQPPKVRNPQDPSGPKVTRAPLIGHHNYVYSLAFSPKGNMLVSSSYDEAVHLWDVRSGALLRSLPAHSDPIGGVDFVRDGTLIVSCASDGLIRVWDTATGQCLRTFFHEDTPPAVSVKFSPNGKYIIAWMLDTCLRLWDYKDGRCVKTYQGHKNEKFSLIGAFGTYGEEVTDDKEQQVNGHAQVNGSSNDKGDVKMNDEGPNPRRKQITNGLKRAFLTSGSEDGCILLWDVVSKNILQKLQGHDGVVLAVDTHPTRSTLVSAGIDKTIRIWKDTGKRA